MGEAINCNYARTAVRELCHKQCGLAKPSRSALTKVAEEYNKAFSNQGTRMMLPIQSAHLRISRVLALFKKPWRPKGQREIFLDVFSLESWNKLPTQSKIGHTIKNCIACSSEHSSLTESFPFKPTTKKHSITFDKTDLSSSTSLVRKALGELNTICRQQFQVSASEAITSTPRSNLAIKPSSQKRQSEMRKIVRETKNAIQQSMEKEGVNTVMSSRLSWRKFDKMRKDDALESCSSLHQTPKRKRSESTTSSENVPPAKRKHGSPLNLEDSAKEDLLSKARLWGENELVNWSELARQYGITKSNGGQSVKEFLKENNIPVALREQRVQRFPRRKRKKLPGGIPFPMSRPSSFHRKKLFDLVQAGNVVQGEPIVPVSVPEFAVDKSSKAITQTSSTVFAKKISLLEIRKKLLEKHQSLGIIRKSSISSSSSQPVFRHLKVWHDHSSMSGHGHLLVLVSTIYDPSFFLTQSEASELGMNFDIQSTVESPEVHIFGRSSSSLDDQALFSAARNECIKELDKPLELTDGLKVFDVLRFFHGDGPAQQFESGNSVGGVYCCVGCGVKWDRIDDIAYAYRCQQLSLADRQLFLLQGVAWKNISVRPLDRLLLADLRKELNMRGISTSGKKKPHLEAEYNEIRLGINNFPALLREKPEESLKSMNLDCYEVSPTEPLHDLKGHLSNIIDETLEIGDCDVHKVVKEIKDSLLSKETVRCSDLRKAAILIYLKLKDMKPDDMLTDLYCTVVEISNHCYAHEDKRTARNILRLHNQAFLHAYYCTAMFSQPKSTTRRRMFGRFFHSLTAHAPLLFRIVSLRSLNTEQHERMFQRAKGITKATSNNHAQQVITNAIQFEEGSDGTIALQESQIKSFALGIGPTKNTFFPRTLLNKISDHYQSHLERIADFLLPGPDVWWTEVPDGFIFRDGSEEPHFREQGPEVSSFRSSSYTDACMKLQQLWELCTGSDIVLPAVHLRYYGQNGDLQEIVSTDQVACTSELSDMSADGSSGFATATYDEPPVNSHEVNIMPSVSHTLMAEPVSPDENSSVGASNSAQLSSHILPAEFPDSSITPPMKEFAAHYESCLALPAATSSNNSAYVFKTTLAKLLSELLQNSLGAELKMFDKLRFRGKTSPSVKSFHRYNELCRLFQTELIKKCRENSPYSKKCKKVLFHEWKIDI